MLLAARRWSGSGNCETVVRNPFGSATNASRKKSPRYPKRSRVGSTVLSPWSYMSINVWMSFCTSLHLRLLTSLRRHAWARTSAASRFASSEESPRHTLEAVRRITIRMQTVAARRLVTSLPRDAQSCPDCNTGVGASVLHSWFVAQDDVAVTECARADQLHREPLGDSLEHRAAFPQDDGNHRELEFVDQAFLHQLRDDRAAAEDRHAFARLLLHLSHFGGDVAFYELRVVP